MKTETAFAKRNEQINLWENLIRRTPLFIASIDYHTHSTDKYHSSMHFLSRALLSTKRRRMCQLELNAVS